MMMEVIHSQLRALDERVNLKHVYRSYHKTTETVIVLLALVTYLDDIIRLCNGFEEHTEMVGYMYVLHRMAASPRNLFAQLVLFAVILLQVAGVASILTGVRARVGCKMLVAWNVLHPIVYSQITNYKFIAEVMSHIGGLLILLAHVHYRCLAPAPGSRGKAELVSSDDDDNEMRPSARLQHAAKLQLIGRILLPSFWLHQGCSTLLADFERKTYYSLASYLFDGLLVLALFAIVGLIVVGLHSRAVALALAVINFFVVCFDHPWSVFPEIAPRSRR